MNKWFTCPSSPSERAAGFVFWSPLQDGYIGTCLLPVEPRAFASRNGVEYLIKVSFIGNGYQESDMLVPTLTV